MPTELTAVVQRLVGAGADPNTLMEEFVQAVAEEGSWACWGDGRWRPDLVCSKCGSPYGGLCADGEPATSPFSGDKAYHKNQEGVTMIPEKVWQEAQ